MVNADRWCTYTPDHDCSELGAWCLQRVNAPHRSPSCARRAALLAPLNRLASHADPIYGQGIGCKDTQIGAEYICCAFLQLHAVLGSHPGPIGWGLPFRQCPSHHMPAQAGTRHWERALQERLQRFRSLAKHACRGIITGTLYNRTTVVLRTVMHGAGMIEQLGSQTESEFLFESGGIRWAMKLFFAAVQVWAGRQVTAANNAKKRYECKLEKMVRKLLNVSK